MATEYRWQLHYDEGLVDGSWGRFCDTDGTFFLPGLPMTPEEQYLAALAIGEQMAAVVWQHIYDSPLPPAARVDVFVKVNGLDVPLWEEG